MEILDFTGAEYQDEVGDKIAEKMLPNNKYVIRVISYDTDQDQVTATEPGDEGGDMYVPTTVEILAADLFYGHSEIIAKVLEGKSTDVGKTLSFCYNPGHNAFKYRADNIPEKYPDIKLDDQY